MLLISDVNKADEGDYRCQATSILGTAESVPVFVDVLGQLLFALMFSGP